MSLATFTPPPNRGVITFLMILGSLITGLDTTIANVAMPHMAGSMSASQGEITWVLTSYIIAVAIMTPVTSWLASRFGRKPLFLVAVIAFTVASALCGAAQSLGQIVVFRVVQGLSGAVMAPMAQLVLLDNYTVEERGRVMGLWGMSTAASPIAGPLLGGWLTDAFDWRTVFYINLPIGLICAIGVAIFMQGGKSLERRAFDLMGFGLLSIAVACLQLVLDRGAEKDWFLSREIVIEAWAAAIAAILFVIHTMTAEHPFIPRALFRDFNFVGATVVGFAMTSMAMSTLALNAPLMETTMNYPVIVAGWTMAPSGVGAFLSMFLAGRFTGRLDNRLLILFGLGLYAVAFDAMSHYSLQMSSSAMALAGFVQGMGSGFIFIPALTMAFITIEPTLRADATGAASLFRNLGASTGIAAMQAIYVRTVQVVHARLAEGVSPLNPMARAPYLAPPFSLSAPAGLAALNGEVTRQASMVAYTDVFHLLSLVPLFMAPAVLFLRSGAVARTAPAVAEELPVFD